VAIKSATQMLKSVSIQIGIGYYAHQDPGPILLLQPGNTDAKDFSKERIAPMIRDTPVLKAIFSESKSRNSDSTITEKLFPGGMLAIAGAGSARNVARRSIRLLFADEIDKYKETAEGNSVPLARKRLATFRHRGKEVVTCSPTTAGSEIDRAYEASDRREYFVPCPHCHHLQSMMGKFHAQVRWDDKLPTKEDQAASARYHCENCGEPWTEGERQSAVEQGKWIAQAPFTGVAGFWISELYSPWKSLPEIVLDFLVKKDKPGDLITFVNTSLAENWVEQGEAPEWERLVNRTRSYQSGTVPSGGLFLTAGADVQRDRIEVEIVAWGKNRPESWSVDYKILDGRTSERDVWLKLDAVLDTLYASERGVEIPLSRLFIDSGDGTTTNDVYAWVRSKPSDRVTAIKGDDRGALPIGQPSPVDVRIDGKKDPHGIKIRTVKVSFFKSEFYACLKLRTPTPEEVANGFGFPPGYCHFPAGPNYGDEHFKQLCAEQLVTITDKRGRTKREWRQTRPRNEALDCRIYARAAAWDFGLDQAQDAHWKALEESLKPPVKPQTPPPSPSSASVPPEETGRRPGSWLPRNPGWLKK
jgi:phage terminase large subunit GpA-like protein